MAEYISIRSDAFSVHLFLDRLHLLNVGYWRKLLKILLQDIDLYQDNRRTADALAKWLPEAVKEARRDAEDKQRDMQDGVKPLARLPKFDRCAQMRKNDRLKAAAKEAEQKAKRLAQFYDIFKEVVLDG